MLRYIHIADRGVIEMLTESDFVALNVTAESGRPVPGKTMRCAKCARVFVKNEQPQQAEQRMIQALQEGEVALREFEEVFIVYDPGPPEDAPQSATAHTASTPTREEVAYAMFFIAAIVLWAAFLYSIFASGFSNTAIAWDITLALFGYGAALLARMYFRRIPRRT